MRGRLPRRTRGQTNVVGVAVLLAMTVLSLGVLTAATGTVVEGGIAAADASRVADGFASFEGERVTRLTYTSGSLSVEPRTVRLLRGRATVVAVDGEALVFESGDRRVVRSAGAVVVGSGEAGTLRGYSPVVVGANRLQVSISTLNVTQRTVVSGAGAKELVAETNASHEYRSLAPSQYALAVETATPSAWERTFERTGARTSRRDFDDDGVVSVVATFDGELAVDLAIHELRTVIRRG